MVGVAGVSEMMCRLLTSPPVMEYFQLLAREREALTPVYECRSRCEKEAHSRYWKRVRETRQKAAGLLTDGEIDSLSEDFEILQSTIMDAESGVTAWEARASTLGFTITEIKGDQPRARRRDINTIALAAESIAARFETRLVGSPDEKIAGL